MSERGQPIYLREDEIIILRPEYAALMEVVERADYYITRLYDAYHGRVVRDLDEAWSAWREAKKRLAALRAAGIHEEEVR